MPVAGKNAASALMMSRQYASLTLQSSQVLTIQTVPVNLVNIIPGYIIIPLWTWFEKPAGTAYVVNGQTAFGLYLGTQIVMYAGAGAGLFDQATATFRFSRGPGTVATPMIGGPVNDINITTGVALSITAATANMTTGNSPVRVSCIYTLIPASPAWS